MGGFTTKGKVMRDLILTFVAFVIGWICGYYQSRMTNAVVKGDPPYSRIDELATKYADLTMQRGVDPDTDIAVRVDPAWIHGYLQEALMEFWQPAPERHGSGRVCH